MDMGSKENAVLCVAFLLLCCCHASTLTCEKVDSCTCEMSDGSGIINLKTIGLQSGSDSTYTISGEDGWLYKYNPCYPFYWIYYGNLAVAQTNGAGTHGYDLGVQSSAFFNMTSSGEVAIEYMSFDALRKSRVLLVCNSGTNKHTLEFVGELITTEYELILNTPCACPGLCNDDGIINPVDETPTGDGININVNSDSTSDDLMWTDVGGAMVALIFHDLLLVIVVAAVVYVVKSRGTADSQQRIPPKKQGFSPSDITGSQPHNAYEVPQNNTPAS